MTFFDFCKSGDSNRTVTFNFSADHRGYLICCKLHNKIGVPACSDMVVKLEIKASGDSPVQTAACVISAAW